MASKKSARKGQKRPALLSQKSLLKVGDPVMVISGGNEQKRPNKGKVGKIRSFAGKKQERVIVEGVNMMTVHVKQTAPDKPSGKISQEGSIHLSNVMYYVEKISKPVRLKSSFLEDGAKVRGYLDPESKEFVQV